MADKQILKYIKQTLDEGFQEPAIRAELEKSGWEKTEIDQAFSEINERIAKQEIDGQRSSQEKTDGFFTRYHKALVILIIILIVLPLIAYGGLWAYQKYFNQAKEEIPEQKTVFEEKTETEQDETTQPKITKDVDAASRDRKRLEDISGLQDKLEEYLNANQSYPPTLGVLVQESYLSALPSDPTTNTSYLYIASKQAPKFYSISFILETQIGTLNDGLNVVSSENRIDLKTIYEQESTVEGKTTQIQSENLIITDLSRIPFYPHEEVVVDIQAIQGINIEHTFLLVNSIKLTDQKAPFRFSFSAPAEPGNYKVNVFAFDDKGNSYFQETTLTVAK